MTSNIIIQKKKKQVIKICKSPKMFKKELYIYQKNLPFIPKLLDHDNKNTLMLEYIDGTPIAELVQPDFSKIASMFITLHSLESKEGKCICHYDNNPKNYLFSKSRYYMLDFSEWEYDYPETDLIHFLLFWASIYDKVKFKQTFRKIIDSYLAKATINPLEWELLIPEVTERFDNRRRKFGKIEKNPDVKINRETLKNIY